MQTNCNLLGKGKIMTRRLVFHAIQTFSGKLLDLR